MPSADLIADSTLEAYLSEQLPSANAAEIESQLRNSESLRERLAVIIARRDVGQHGVGDIWRTARLSCPTRVDVGRFLEGSGEVEERDYIRFHLERVGCRYCQANVDDLRNSDRSETDTSKRRKRYFETSVGRLGHRPE
ncbi:hypothetical protein [Stratiformator vulcanicus]|uniref:Uncharacterized protein n=1 Tax=Stratiformator vulcanicus TaxID=2527980 RepID=A0A517QXS3_9PLAN|nr:hypothetical protein [Stratiformator vulcanicus]QDT36456.1 hypothetical protein Pan189_08130 [Stratiformator vulcanicus]